jgi:hypothetical protein
MRKLTAVFFMGRQKFSGAVAVYRRVVATTSLWLMVIRKP